MSRDTIEPRNFKPAIVYTIYIAATPEKVWQALTTAEFSRKVFLRLRDRDRLESRRRLHRPRARRLGAHLAAR